MAYHDGSDLFGAGAAKLLAAQKVTKGFHSHAKPFASHGHFRKARPLLVDRSRHPARSYGLGEIHSCSDIFHPFRRQRSRFTPFPPRPMPPRTAMTVRRLDRPNAAAMLRQPAFSAPPPGRTARRAALRAPPPDIIARPLASSALQPGKTAWQPQTTAPQPGKTVRPAARTVPLPGRTVLRVRSTAPPPGKTAWPAPSIAPPPGKAAWHRPSAARPLARTAPPAG